MNYRDCIKSTARAGEYVPYLALAAASGAVPAMTIGLRGGIIDLAAQGAGGPGFFVPLGLLVALSLFGAVSAAVRGRISERHGIRASALIDARRLEKAAKVAFPVTETERFHALWQSSADAPETDSRIFRAAGDMTELVTKLVLSLRVLWTMDPWTAGGIVLLLAVGVALNRELARRTGDFWPRYRENMRRTNYLSSLLLYREYAGERKLFSFDGEIDRRYREAFSKAKGENARLGRGRFRIEALMQLVFAVYSVGAALMLLRPLQSGRITLGLFTSAFYAAAGLEVSCRQIYAAAYDILGSARKLEGYCKLMELEDEPAGEAPTGEDGQIRSVELRDVTFTYPGGERPVQRHLSLRLEPGRHYALVGENGCGKSTLVKLLVGLYRPDSGQILVNGREVHTLPTRERQRLFAVVFQDFYRYPLTIRENVSLGLDSPAGDGELGRVFDRLDFRNVTAGRVAGYDSNLTPLHSSGAGLSGGEWQKLAVARCVLSKARFAVLDEPNAALDPMAEAAVYGAYRELLADRTTLFISHRLGGVRMADKIFVLRDGALEAAGTHEELMDTCGYYAELFNTQKGMYV